MGGTQETGHRTQDIVTLSIVLPPPPATPSAAYFDLGRPFVLSSVCPQKPSQSITHKIGWTDRQDDDEDGPLLGAGGNSNQLTKYTHHMRGRGDDDGPIEKPFYLLQNESEPDIPNQQQSDKNSTIHFRQTRPAGQLLWHSIQFIIRFVSGPIGARNLLRFSAFI